MDGAPSSFSTSEDPPPLLYPEPPREVSLPPSHRRGGEKRGENQVRFSRTFLLRERVGERPLRVLRQPASFHKNRSYRIRSIREEKEDLPERLEYRM